MIPRLLPDLRYALRRLSHSPVFSLIAIASLAIGLGGNTAIFSLMDQALFRPLPVPNPERMVALEQPNPIPGGYRGDRSYRLFSYPMFQELTRHLSGLEDSPLVGIAARRPDAVALRDPQAGLGEPEVARVEIVSGNYFDVLGIEATVGRLLTPADDVTRGGHPVVVLGHRMWTRRYGADPGVIGRSIQVNDTPMTIVGVAPEGFYGASFDVPPEIYAPLAMKKQLTPTWDWMDDPNAHWLHLIGRLQPGARAEQAAAVLQTPFHAALEEDITASVFNFEDARLAQLRNQNLAVNPEPGGVPTLRDSAGVYFYTLMAMAALVLLITCTNLASLLTARSFARRKESAARLAIGASRGDLVRQFLVESILLAVLGAAGGLLVSVWTNSWIIQIAGEDGAMLSAAIDPRMLLFSAAVALLTGILFGLLPAWQASGSRLDAVLRNESSSVAGDGPQRWLRQGLLVAQLALSLTMIVGAGLFSQSLRNLERSDPGFMVEGMAVFTVDASRLGYDAERTHRIYAQLPGQLTASGTVEAAGISSVRLLANSRTSNAMQVEGYQPAAGENLGLSLSSVSPGFFATMGIPLTSGREFTPQDQLGQPKVAIVNQEFVRRYLPEQNPLGHRIGQGLGEPDTEIVGVVADTKYDELRKPVEPLVFFSLAQLPAPARVTVYIKSTTNVEAAMATVSDAVRQADPGIVVERLQSMPQQVAENILPERLLSRLCGVAGILAALLAAIGLYGVTALHVERRTKEIGVRMALGAGRVQVLALILQRVAWTCLMGLALGIPAALYMGRVSQSLLYEVPSSDPFTLTVAALFLTFVALGAGWLPARRATRVDPMVSLRMD